MKADRIIKNAKIYTSDKNNPQASALVVKDGKFAYVGDEAGLSAYEGEVADLGGKFIIPACRRQDGFHQPGQERQLRRFGPRLHARRFYGY